jgi:hypothetical protein
MKIFILPGYSLHNKDWAYEVKGNLEPHFEVEVHEWKHWSEGGSLSLKFEVEKILEEVGKKKVSFIAKSIGTRVLMSVVPKTINQIDKVILCGIPIDPVGYAKGIKLLGPDRLLVIQNSQDPFMPAKAIKLYLRLIDKNIKFVEKIARNHDYPYFKDFLDFLR